MSNMLERLANLGFVSLLGVMYYCSFNDLWLSRIYSIWVKLASFDAFLLTVYACVPDGLWSFCVFVCLTPYLVKL